MSGYWLKSPREFRAWAVQRQSFFHSNIHAFDLVLTKRFITDPSQPFISMFELGCASSYKLRYFGSLEAYKPSKQF